MDASARCPECRAADCEARFHACLAADFADPDHGVVHHLVVAAYGLQHRWYVDAAVPPMVSFVLDHLDRPPTDADRRRLREATDGPVRVRARDTPLAAPPAWRLNVEHVDRRTPEAYTTTVRAWAASVAGTLRYLSGDATGE